jgi:hypothetical protein
MDYYSKLNHMTKLNTYSSSWFSSSSFKEHSSKLVLLNQDTKTLSFLRKKFRYLFNLNSLATFCSNNQQETIDTTSTSNILHKNTISSNNRNNNYIIEHKLVNKADFVHLKATTNQEKYINYLNYYYQINYQQNIIYYNYLILALIVLFVLFSVLVLLEETDTYYTLSAITFLLLITFNLIIIIFSHNFAKQFYINKSLIN